MSGRLHQFQLIGVALVISLVATSCMPPNLHVDFVENGKRREKIKVRDASGDISLELSTFSFLSCHGSGKYGLSLTVKVRGGEALKRVTAHPDEISVLLRDKPLDRDDEFPTATRNGTLQQNSYEVILHFKATDGLELRNGVGGLPMKIEFGAFLMRDGQPVEIRAVHAVESKHCE